MYPGLRRLWILPNAGRDPIALIMGTSGPSAILPRCAPNGGQSGGQTLASTVSVDLSITNAVFKMVEPTTGVEGVTYALPSRPSSDLRWPAPELQRRQRQLSRVAVSCPAHWWWNGGGQRRLRTRSMALTAARRFAARGLSCQSAHHGLVPFELPAVSCTDPPFCSGDLLAQPYFIVERTGIASGAVEIDATSSSRNIN